MSKKRTGFKFTHGISLFIYDFSLRVIILGTAKLTKHKLILSMLLHAFARSIQVGRDCEVILSVFAIMFVSLINTYFSHIGHKDRHWKGDNGQKKGTMSCYRGYYRHSGVWEERRGVWGWRREQRVSHLVLRNMIEIMQCVLPSSKKCSVSLMQLANKILCCCINVNLSVWLNLCASGRLLAIK